MTSSPPIRHVIFTVKRRLRVQDMARMDPVLHTPITRRIILCGWPGDNTSLYNTAGALCRKINQVVKVATTRSNRERTQFKGLLSTLRASRRSADVRHPELSANPLQSFMTDWQKPCSGKPSSDQIKSNNLLQHASPIKSSTTN